MKCCTKRFAFKNKMKRMRTSHFKTTQPTQSRNIDDGLHGSVCTDQR